MRPASIAIGPGSASCRPGFFAFGRAAHRHRYPGTTIPGASPSAIRVRHDLLDRIDESPFDRTVEIGPREADAAAVPAEIERPPRDGAAGRDRAGERRSVRAGARSAAADAHGRAADAQGRVPQRRGACVRRTHARAWRCAGARALADVDRRGWILAGTRAETAKTEARRKGGTPGRAAAQAPGVGKYTPARCAAFEMCVSIAVPAASGSRAISASTIARCSCHVENSSSRR